MYCKCFAGLDNLRDQRSTRQPNLITIGNGKLPKLAASEVRCQKTAKPQNVPKGGTKLVCPKLAKVDKPIISGVYYKIKTRIIYLKTANYNTYYMIRQRTKLSLY